MPTASIRDDPLYRFSLRIAGALNPPVLIGPRYTTGLELLLDGSKELQRQYRLLSVARCRDWSLATEQLAARLPATLRRLSELVPTALAQLQPDTPTLPVTVRSVYQELLALQEEFGSVHLDGRAGVVGAITEAIELEGVRLGPFRIELHLQRLSRGNLQSAIYVVALEPNPAACSDGTTHPHVRDGIPCLGEATAPVGAALRDGRLLDTFLAVASVLRTYNLHSPYVALEEWDGRGCEDCGRHRSADDLFNCESCEADYCSGCISTCDGCDGTFCLTCLERGTEDENLCSGCRGRCRECGRISAKSQLDDNGGLCDGCADAAIESPEGDEDVTDVLPAEMVVAEASPIPSILQPEMT